MNSFKTIPRKLLYLVIAFFFIHLILQLAALFFIVFAMGTGIETGQSPWWDDLSWVSFNILSFPFISLLSYLLSPFTVPLSFGWVFFILNSALWSLGFYFLVRKFGK